MNARLLHLADSALPTGGYAFSYGLESSAKLGYFKSASDLTAYLLVVLQQVAAAELPYVASCYDLEEPLADGLVDIAEDYNGTMLVPSMRRASLTQARTWLRIMSTMYPDAQLNDISAWFKQQGQSLHYTLAYAVGMRRCGIGWPDARLLLLYCSLRDQISAAVRLGLLAPTAAHLILHDQCERQFPTLDCSRDYTDAVRCAPLLDIAQGAHSRVYAKLFQN